MNYVLDYSIILLIVFLFNYIGQKYINNLKIEWKIFITYLFLQTSVIFLLLTFVF